MFELVLHLINIKLHAKLQPDQKIFWQQTVFTNAQMWDSESKKGHNSTKNSQISNSFFISLLILSFMQNYRHIGKYFESKKCSQMPKREILRQKRGLTLPKIARFFRRSNWFFISIIMLISSFMQNYSQIGQKSWHRKGFTNAQKWDSESKKGRNSTKIRLFFYVLTRSSSNQYYASCKTTAW